MCNDSVLKIRFFFITLFCMLYLLISAPSTYAAALPGNGSSLSISNTAVGLTFAGTSGNRYHYYLNVMLPIGLNPSNLTFGTPSTARTITEYDFISYSGNSLVVDFFYMSDGNTYTYQLATLDSAYDMSECEIVSYGVVSSSVADVPGSTMFIYDKVLALRQWMNTSHYLSSIDNNLSISSTSDQYTARTYVLDTTGQTVTVQGQGYYPETTSTGVSMPHYYNITSTSYDQYLTSARLSTESTKNLNYLTSAQLTGGLTSSTSFDILNDEWGQFVDRVSVIGSLSLSNPAFSQFLPGDIYFPFVDNQSMTITPSSGYIFTNGMTPTYMTFVIDLSARPSSVSLSGCDLVSWSYNAGRLTIEARKENQSTDSTISLNSISITLSAVRTSFPFIQISNFCVGTFEIGSMISAMDEQKNGNMFERGFKNIQSAFNSLLSGLTLGYNSDTSEDKASFDDSASELDTKTTEYVTAEETLTNTVSTHIDSFSPSFASTPSDTLAAFALVGTVTNQMYQRSGPFQYIISFTLTLGCVLFVLGLRKR